jgi:hypothetical protein
MINHEEWFRRCNDAAQELVGQARGTDDEVKLRMGTYLMAFIGLAKVEGLNVQLQVALLEGMNKAIIALDGRKAAHA